MRQIFLLITLFFIFLSQTSKSQNTDTVSQVQNLLPDAFSEAIQGRTDPLVIDVRDNRYYKKYKIKGAIHAAKKEKLFSIVDSLDKKEPLFLYCQVGFRSTQAANILAEKGFKNVLNLKKGIRNWKKEGYPVIKIKKNERKKNE